MELRGIEPRTSRMRSEHSTPELQPQPISIKREHNLATQLYLLGQCNICKECPKSNMSVFLCNSILLVPMLLMDDLRKEKSNARVVCFAIVDLTTCITIYLAFGLIVSSASVYHPFARRHRSIYRCASSSRCFIA